MKEDKLSLTDAAIDKIIYHVSGGIDIQELLCFFEEFSRSGRECRDYPEISNKIYNMDYLRFESLKMFFGVSEKNHDNVFENMIQSFDWIDDSRRIDNLVHFERHVRLSCQQRDYMDKVASGARKEAAIAKKESNEASDRIKKVYSEFVGILGVFTALSFALMGSVQVFGNLLSNVSNPNIRTIGYVLVVAGAYLLLIYLVVSMLFIGMKKVFEGNSKYDLSDTFTRVIISASVMLIIIGSLMVCVKFGY